MANRNFFNKIVGHYSIENLKNDSDGDKVMDGLDCQPNNPDKQGWVHDAVTKAKEKYNTYNDERLQRKEDEKVIQEKAKVAAREAYIKERERVLTERAVRSAKENAQSQSVISTLQNVVKNIPSQMVTSKKSKTKSKLFNNYGSNLDKMLVSKKKSNTNRGSIFDVKI